MSECKNYTLTIHLNTKNDILLREYLFIFLILKAIVKVTIGNASLNKLAVSASIRSDATSASISRAKQTERTEKGLSSERHHYGVINKKYSARQEQLKLHKRISLLH